MLVPEPDLVLVYLKSGVITTRTRQVQPIDTLKVQELQCDDYRTS
jgi:hypothetical protein